MRRLYKNRILHLITHTFHHSRNTRLKEQVVLPEIDGSCIEARRQTNEEHAVAGEPLELAGTKQTFRKFTTGILRFVTFRIIALAFVLLEFTIFTRALFRGILQTQPIYEERHRVIVNKVMMRLGKTMLLLLYAIKQE
ncbi:hypothetical protein HanPSC8_Chr10g0427281 [Helianthus annuus]|nr:hypothetical protein HanPSC8_Chr10g0427281 [Helianthus annuus]